jgi:predicted DsbA family dithiol-disulfide isomerase
VLLRLCADVGLDAQRASAILDSDEFADAVRERERFYQQQGISAVPSVIIDDRHLIQGGQPPEAFERALRQLSAETGRAG